MGWFSGRRSPTPEEPTRACEGPLIWYTVDGLPCSCGTGHSAAILHCAAKDCGYIVCSGNYNDPEHAQTDIMREGLA